MTVVVPKGEGDATLPLVCSPPVLAGPLGTLIEAMPADWFPATWRRPCDVTLRIAASWPVVGKDAVGALAQLDRLFVPAPPALIEAWLLRVALGVRNPPGDADMTARIELVQDTCRDLPTFLWTHDTRRRFAQRGPDAAFWPSDADVFGFLSQTGWEHYRLRRLLQGIIRVGRTVQLPDALPAPPPALADATAARRIAQGVTAALVRKGGRYSAALPPASAGPVQPPPDRPTLAMGGDATMSHRADTPAYVLANRVKRGVKPALPPRPAKGNA